MRVWNQSHRGAFMLHAHSHHSLQENPNALSFDVGINGPEYDYKPIEFEYIKERMSKKEYTPIDKHRK